MDPVRILHNPRCSKSRGALALLEAGERPVEVVRYLDAPPSAEELREIIALLDQPASALVRRDANFRATGADPATLDDPERVVALLLEHPTLMERPIVIRGRRALIARPPERAAELL